MDMSKSGVEGNSIPASVLGIIKQFVLAGCSGCAQYRWRLGGDGVTSFIIARDVSSLSPDCRQNPNALGARLDHHKDLSAMPYISIVPREAGKKMKVAAGSASPLHIASPTYLVRTSLSGWFFQCLGSLYLGILMSWYLLICLAWWLNYHRKFDKRSHSMVVWGFNQ